MFITHLDIFSSRQYSRLNQKHGKDPVHSFDTNFSVLCNTWENSDVLIESMDACFGLARKIAKGGWRSFFFSGKMTLTSHFRILAQFHFLQLESHVV